LPEFGDDAVDMLTKTDTISGHYDPLTKYIINDEPTALSLAYCLLHKAPGRD